MFLREMLRRSGFEFEPLFGGVSPMRFWVKETSPNEQVSP